MHARMYVCIDRYVGRKMGIRTRDGFARRGRGLVNGRMESMQGMVGISQGEEDD